MLIWTYYMLLLQLTCNVSLNVHDAPSIKSTRGSFEYDQVNLYTLSSNWTEIDTILTANKGDDSLEDDQWWLEEGTGDPYHYFNMCILPFSHENVWSKVVLCYLFGK
jgi:hypothetical protein